MKESETMTEDERVVEMAKREVETMAQSIGRKSTAKRFGVSPNTISNWTNGKSMRPKNARAVLKVAQGGKRATPQGGRVELIHRVALELDATEKLELARHLIADVAPML